MMDEHPKEGKTMESILQKIQRLLHPTVDRDKALRIAQKQCTPLRAFEIYDSMPANWNIYRPKKDKPGEHWYVRAPSVVNGLSNSHAIIISRESGEVVYDGSAGDEG